MRTSQLLFVLLSMAGCKTLANQPPERVDLRQAKDAKKGERGEKGDKGDTGARGKAGDSCRVEDRFLICGNDRFDLSTLKGEKGEQGEKGEEGMAGAQGPKGEMGSKGDKGETGMQGLPGETKTEDGSKTNTPDVLIVDKESDLNLTACSSQLIVVRELSLLYFCDPSTKKWRQLQGQKMASPYEGYAYLNQCSTVRNPTTPGESYYQAVRLEFSADRAYIAMGPKHVFSLDDEAEKLALCKQELRDHILEPSITKVYWYKEVADGKLILDFGGYKGQVLFSLEKRFAELYLGEEKDYNRSSDFEMNLYSTQGFNP